MRGDVRSALVTPEDGSRRPPRTQEGIELSPLEGPPPLAIDQRPPLQTSHELTRRQRRELRELRRDELRESTRRRRREARLRTREVAADWLMIAGGILLLLALFLPWSRQFSAAMLSRFGASAALTGVPRSPDAWQVYSSSDVLLAVLGAGLAAVAFAGRRMARLVCAAAVLLAAAFVLHALAVPPTNGAQLVEHAGGAVRYMPDAPRSGPGELLALIGLGVALAGIALSLPILD